MLLRPVCDHDVDSDHRHIGRKSENKRERQVDFERNIYRIVKTQAKKKRDDICHADIDRSAAFFSGSIETKVSRLYEDTKEFALQFDMLWLLDKSEYFRS